ncbi:glycoside hydrolase family 3 C-terminal domain-containing protein [Pelomonas sp. UHG3]|uniref:Glycoside hydrolase family 3 C-terminal domain-containing protein n=1 Tax=Roseateles hydrophilus TaxID=2975054 RepID=A0ACC6CC66_9BURK|nr:glycoside hydrolase family 3 C-terminal domain-containing protein [Pelomonas sp. UHG3]MCY4745865.1 glycoside hydrolase family 3 C-terminal domain-containing protein [Pelomonas sp. UHG3]
MKTLTAACLVWGMTVAGLTGAATNDDVERRARDLVGALTLDEKLEQLLNGAPAVPRLGIPAYNWWTESLHGAFGPGATTNFPQPVGLAASFNDRLMHDVASAISTEVQAVYALGRGKPNPHRMGGALNTWSPNINIFRDPRWGRGQETYGEDPFLTARLGQAFVQGMQGPDPARPRVIATPKHFAVHSGPESTRHSVDVWVSMQDLEDTYLPAFRAAMVDAQAGSIMCAYNRVNGEPACASRSLLMDTLRRDWGFKGYVVSDCDAVVDIHAHHKYAPDAAAGAALALRHGVDNECNGATLSHTPGLGERYRQALQRGYVREADIDTALQRLFAARLRVGDLPGAVSREFPAEASINSTAHRALALRAAVESLVLLKNDGTLPLKAAARVAVVGPLADARRVMRGNYSSAQTGPTQTVHEALRQLLPAAQVTLLPFGASITDGDAVPSSVFLTPDGQPGLQASYHLLQHGSPQAAGQRRYERQAAATHRVPALESRPQDMLPTGAIVRTVWTGFFVAPETGTYRLGLAGVQGRLRVDGRDVSLAKRPTRWAEPVALTQVALKRGERHALRFETESGVSAPPGMMWKRVSTRPLADLRAGLREVDVVVAVTGLTSDLEGEEMPVKIEGFSGGDRTSLDLPADQRAYLQAAAAAGKPLVVVNLSGSAVNLAWADQHAAAVLQAWYPGEGGGQAIAQVLTGAANPAGRLPVTFYRSAADLPSFDDYRMAGRTYRFFDKPVVYPFGHGLSYASFRYDTPQVALEDDGQRQRLVVRTAVTNHSARDGDEVVQLYLTPPRFEGGPRLALRAFERLQLRAGERRELRFELGPRELSFVDRDGQRLVMPGDYRLAVGGGQPGTGAPGASAAFTITRAQALPR